MIRRRIVAAGLALVGAVMVARPDLFRSPTYTVAEAIAPLRWWGAAFLTVAVVSAARATPRVVAVAVLAGHITSWALALAAAVATGDAASPTAWVPWLIIAALVLHAAGRPADG